MKSCPQCGKEYPDSEVFCDTDGQMLAAGGSRGGGRATTVMPAEGEGTRACPVCGGTAQPGEIICNFCGSRLGDDAPQPAPAGGGARSGNFVLSQGPGSQGIGTSRGSGPREFGTAPVGDQDPWRNPLEENDSGGRSVFGMLGFSLLAIIAVIAGVWFAMYWTRHNQPAPIVQASPTQSPAAAPAPGPIVQLAQTIPLQVSGDLAGGLERNRDSLGKVFADNKSSLVDVYGKALGSDAEFRDGMVVRIHIMPDGSVSDGSVRVSTSLNPSLDAEVVNTLRGWKFASAAGSAGVDADYPIIFASKPSDTEAIESDLKSRLANLGPNEAPEYASGAEASPLPPPSPAAAVSPEGSPGPPPSGLAAAPPAEAPPAPAPAFEAPTETSPAPPAKPKHRRREMASAETRPLHHEPPLSVRVLDELHANRKLRRVQAFTNGSTVMLSGKVFDDNDKALAFRTARSVDGVTSVMNNITTDQQDWARNAALIQQQLQNAGLSGVNVRVIGKSAYLDGEVKKPEDRDRAETIAVSAAPVIVRENLIRVAPGNMFGF